MTSYNMSLVLIVLLAAASQGLAQTALSDWTAGVATNYGGPNDGDDPNSPTFGLLNGACGFGNLGNAAAYPFFSAVGIPTNSDIMSFPTMGCGTCIEFQCVNDRTPGFAGRCGAAGATVTALVTDVCPECSAASGGQGDHFDLNALSFGQLAPDLAGRIDVNYRLVACTPPSDIKVLVDGNGGSGLWLRLVITTVANLGTISAVNLKGPGAGDSWTAMTNTYGAAWEVSNQPSYPISLEVTSGSQTVSLMDVLPTATQGTFTSTQQFTMSGSTTTTTTPTSSTTTSSTTVTSSTSTSATPTTTATATPASSAATACSDIVPQGSAFTCPQQAAYGQCGADWMVGFCHQSCNSC